MNIRPEIADKFACAGLFPSP
ncbi:hypothetical protein RCEC007_100119 [Escherichia coli]|nr:hypothetical protein RCEC007_100119 [Escherichia coli]